MHTPAALRKSKDAGSPGWSAMDEMAAGTWTLGPESLIEQVGPNGHPGTRVVLRGRCLGCRLPSFGGIGRMRTHRTALALLFAVWLPACASAAALGPAATSSERP